jgi:poly-gamma-glutamate synthase PgsB/CapB
LISTDITFLSPIQNSQAALALFAGGFAALFLAEAFWKRRRLARARARIPLTIGGWGTRGKSGTERLKAALFHGMGYEVFVKTTGCEAMIIHSVPDEPARELFIFRSYDKATIWEMRDTLELAAALGSEVYLWECMALTPSYVELLQKDWMRDDLVTITNAYPDHEDIQGPAGIDIAECVASFIPDGATCVTSEVNFLPLFAETARRRDTRLIASTPREADLIAEDLLALFPYKEHPRNIALVARLAEELGIERSFAIATMAEHVVPDIGVLKAYPPARVRGRTLSFVNGMSANERTGFLNNWTRMGLDAVDLAREPERMVVTVVNNRADRVTRSEVFARILVEDAAADAHLLIGTNLSGLRSYIHHELDAFVKELEVLVEDDLRAPGATQPFVRLGKHLARLRVPHPDWREVRRRLEIYAGGVGLAVVDVGLPLLEEELVRIFAGEALEVATVRAELEADSGLRRVFDGALRPARMPASPYPEVVGDASPDDAYGHFVAQLARITVHARLRARLEDAIGAASPDVAGYHAAFRGAYRALFLDSLIVVPDPGERGDAIIDRCARACPPGTTVTVMGIQNIKGTGLDFVYRWLALDHVTRLLAEANGGSAEARMRALRALESFEDHGLLDAGVGAATLGAAPAADLDDAEAAYRRKVTGKLRRVHAERLAALAHAGGKRWLARVLDRVERWIDPLDSIRRRSHARRVMKDLVARRISHGRAAIEMRRLYDRQKGGWLSERAGGRKA